MKILFIPAKSKTSIQEVLKKVKIKEKFGIATTIQYLDQVKKLKIKNATIVNKPILGCDASECLKIKSKVKAFLYIGSGPFHPREIAFQTNLPVYIANPLTNKFSKIQKEEIEDYKKRIKGKQAKFLMSDRIGILVSTKPGQYQLKKAQKIKKKLKKESFIFMFNKLENFELENFPDIDFWINTACPRIESKNVINARDLL